MMHESKGQRIGKAPSLHLFQDLRSLLDINLTHTYMKNNIIKMVGQKSQVEGLEIVKSRDVMCIVIIRILPNMVSVQTQWHDFLPLETL